MPFDTLKAHIHRLYAPVLFLEDVFPRARRHAIARGLDIALGIALFLSLFAYGLSHEKGAELFPALSFFGALAYRFYGMLLLVFCIRFPLFMLEAFYRSYYFTALENATSAETALGTRSARDAPVDFELASLIHRTASDDLTLGFFVSRLGGEVALRAGITPEMLERFMNGPRTKVRFSQVTIPAEGGITLSAYALALRAADSALNQFLFASGVSDELFAQAATWTARRNRRRALKERWWSRENLGRIPGIGKTWSYGETYILERYGHDMVHDPAYSIATESIPQEHDPLSALETALAKSNQANALLLANDVNEPRVLLARLAKLIRRGYVLPPLEHKQVFLVDPEAIIASHHDKGSFERECGLMLNQAVRAGNIILAFSNLPGATESARTIGVNLLEWLTPYLSSDMIQVVAIAETGAYHRVLLSQSAVAGLFEVVRIPESKEENEGVLMLEDFTSHLEAESGIIVSYPALVRIYDGATRYFPDAVMPDKAVDLLTEALPSVLREGRFLVTVMDVDSLLQSKTGIPFGEVSAPEREKLLGLEAAMRGRVVGQEEAVRRVSDALRRARAGVRDTNRPVGSFLFLGPTGVGKTETAKALAESFFGSEDALMRLDMSEFQTVDALDRLIGSPGSEPGRLATMLREKQYGVLLLDEFEKATRGVHDLFLQILDEGEFTDAEGKKVSARNILFIMTSNAGAQEIWDIVKRGENLQGAREGLIDRIISQGIFRPEFLNRFDDIVLFHPLERPHIEQIARLKLQGLAKRLRERGIDLAITDELVGIVSDAGFDPKFGGRPMNRAIQEKVEQVVADKLLRGEIKPGAHVTLSQHDLAPLRGNE